MAQLIDWVILSNNPSVTTVMPEDPTYSYDLFNVSCNEALRYGERPWGINLVWGDPASSDSIRFQRESGSREPIKFEEPIAINVKGGAFLVYQRRDKGVNLGWSKTPKYEWKILGGNAGSVVETAKRIGLYSAVENDSLMYEIRDWGINLKWFKDSGKYQKFSNALRAGESILEAAKEVGGLVSLFS